MILSNMKTAPKRPVQYDQRGAVWAEFVVVAGFVLVGVITLVPLMGKMIDTRHKVEMSGRYAAWERTVWFQTRPSYHPNRNLAKSNAQLQNEIHHRIFSEPDTVLHSEQHRDLKGLVYDPMVRFNNPTKRRRDRYDNLLVKKGEVAGEDSFVQLRQTDSNPPGEATRLITNVLGTINRFGNARVNQKGYYSGQVSVEIKEFSWIPEFKGVKPNFTTGSAILTDGWNVGGPDDAKKRVTPFLPQDWIDGDVTDVLQDVAGFFFDPLKSSSLDIGRVDSEPVPRSRLTRYRSR
ncbi:hypothetical protein GCM10008090_03450 [Arenicella chitinivorans]|uniref:Uncharacterized protein n=1 Tax=Arenicella chitinivorans TaxID=1329800 RepID=A0A918RKB4_9GAMM|nr:hypothetical protein [Arenicella chitinivorans]GGZ98328.1 hypothetical protein GCM10008090_03450 [Arenicella chitinivorans]